MFCGDADMTDNTPRWFYRHDNFGRAFVLLREAVTILEIRALSALEKEGLIQRFEYTWELAWKTMKDVLEAEGLSIDLVSPNRVIRTAAEAGLIADAGPWLAALDTRNRLAHSCSAKTFDAAVEAIRTNYLAAFDAFNDMLVAKRLDG
jgi:nucleotidyltransferase substrate binding protein (TIGR01987 family)